MAKSPGGFIAQEKNAKNIGIIKIPKHIIQILAKYGPSKNCLLYNLCELVDTSMLKEISEADYGQGADTAFTALSKIKETKEIPTPMVFSLQEVLALTRWLEPAEPEWKRGHSMRAFASLAMLLAATNEADAFAFSLSEGQNDTLAQLLESILVLDSEIQTALSSFLAWRVMQCDEYSEIEAVFFILALLLLSVLSDGVHIKEGDLGRLMDWMLDIEISVRRGWGELNEYQPHNKKWLLDLASHRQRHEVWKVLTRRMLEKVEAFEDDEVHDKLKNIGERILGENMSQD